MPAKRNDCWMFTVVFSLLIVVCASFICSMAEAAILSLPVIRARILVEEKRINAKDVLYLKEHISFTVATIVLIGNSINIVGSVYVGQEVAHKFGEQWLGLASGVLTFVIIVFGEILPKALGERFKIPLSLFFAAPLRVVVWVFRPVVGIAMLLARPWTHGYKVPRVTEDEIKMMLKIGRDSGTVEIDEEALINRVFHLNDLRAVNIMKPLKDIYMLPADKNLGEAKEQIIMSPYNRVVIYEGDVSNIVGIVEHRVLLREMAKDNHEAKIRQWMIKPIFVNQMTKADVLMEKFQSFHQHLFIVQDNQARNVGLVTMEDVLEELFGEIYDEKDIRFKMMARQSPKTS